MPPVKVRSLVAPLLTALLLATPSPSAFAHGPAPSQAPTTPPGRAVAEQLTLELAQLNARFHRTAASQRASLEAQMVSVALAREQALSALLEDDPAEFLRVALPSSHRSTLPAVVQAHMEQETDVEGTIEVLHQDDAAGGRYLHHLDTPVGRLTLKFAADEPDTLVTGAHVRVHGVQLDSVLALSSGTTSVQTLSSGLTNTFGDQKTLVILVTFADNSTQPYTADYAKSIVFTSTSNFYLENSFSQTWLTGTVVGWYPIPLKSTSCDYSTLASQANSAASAAGVNLSGYTRYVYAFPYTTACNWSGLGTIGGNPSKAWINGTLNLRVVAHEVGHNLGLYHSHGLDCGTVTLGSNCSVLEYADPVDMMGSATPSGHYNAFQKERLGWLNYGTSPSIFTVPSSGTYELEPYESPSGGGAKALKILQSVDSGGKRTWYYVEYRQALGFDSGFSTNTNVLNGVVVRLGTESTPNSSYLLDMTPATTSWLDPALAVGLSYSDSSAGVTITPAWANGTGAAVSVSIGTAACTLGVPAVTISPSQSQWVTPGTTVAYTVSVTNHDSAGCAAATFTMQAAVPAGWTSSGAASLTLNPNATGSVVLNVTSPATATAGFYTIDMSATNSTVAGGTATASATYVIASSINVSASTNQASYTRRQTVSVSAAVSSDGSPVANASVAFTITKANGKRVTGTASTGSNGVAAYQFQLRANDPSGTYQARADAKIGGALSGSATTSFVVQ